MLFIISAPSGAGKTTIVREVMKQIPDLVFSVSATTRKKRDYEIDGKDYFFITKEEFERKIKEGEFVEYEKIFDGNYYGTLKSFVDNLIKENKDIIFDVDVMGALSLKNYYKDKAVLIFLEPPDKEEVKRRLIARGTETEEQIKNRLERFEIEMAKMKYFNYIILNDNLEKAVKELVNLILLIKKGDIKNASTNN